MARHLIIGNGGTANISTTTGLEVNQAISIEKMSPDGPTPLAMGDSFQDAPQIRFVQGTASGPNIFSPWIYGNDVLAYSGVSYTAPAAHQHTVTYANTSGTAGVLTIKFVRVDGPQPEFWSFDTDIPASTAHTAADALVTTSYAAASPPDWLEDVCTDTGNANVFEGAIRGDVANSGNTWDYSPAIFHCIVESYTGTTLTATATAYGSATQAGHPGYGDGNAVLQMERDLKGINYGYYNRLELPNTPTDTAVAATNYDMYHILSSKDGSSSSQINGVDNLIEINIATTAGDADSLIFENLLNSYFAGAFNAVTL